MNKAEANERISAEFERRIGAAGLTGQLELEPIPNRFKERRAYFKRKRDGMPMFSVFLWQLNTLEGEELQQEIDRRIEDAARHFNITEGALS